MTKPVTNFAASVRARLLHDTQRKRGNFQLVLRRYLVERFDEWLLGGDDKRWGFVTGGPGMGKRGPELAHASPSARTR